MQVISLPISYSYIPSLDLKRTVKILLLLRSSQQKTGTEELSMGYRGFHLIF